MAVRNMLDRFLKQPIEPGDRLGYPIRVLVRLIATLVAAFIALDLLGRCLPVFPVDRWGTFAEWALAILTPGAILLTFATWSQDREDRQSSESERTRMDARLERSRREESASGLKLKVRQGAHNEVVVISNDTTHNATVTRTTTDGTLQVPIDIEAGQSRVLGPVTLPTEIEVEFQGATFSINRAGVRLVSELPEPPSPDYERKS